MVDVMITIVNIIMSDLLSLISNASFNEFINIVVHSNSSLNGY